MMNRMALRVGLAEAVVADEPALRDLLDDHELARADRKRDPVPFVSAHALARRTLATALEVSPTSLDFERRCPTCGSDRHGKPSIVGRPEWAFSLSYTDTLAVIAVVRGPSIGVDVEHVDEADFDSFARLTLAPEEGEAFEGMHGRELLSARAQVWARKEAILKATGHGLVVDPTEIVVTGPSEAPALVRWQAQEERPRAVSLADATLSTPEHRSAVAVLTEDELEITRID